MASMEEQVKDFAIVVFSEENLTALVPSNWMTKLRNSTENGKSIISGKCYWPNTKDGNRINTLAKKRAEPNLKQWKCLSITVDTFFDTYKAARFALRVSSDRELCKSDEDIDDEARETRLSQKRRRDKTPELYISDSDDEDLGVEPLGDIGLNKKQKNVQTKSPAKGDIPSSPSKRKEPSPSKSGLKSPSKQVQQTPDQPKSPVKRNSPPRFDSTTSSVQQQQQKAKTTPKKSGGGLSTKSPNKKTSSPKKKSSSVSSNSTLSQWVRRSTGRGESADTVSMPSTSTLSSLKHGGRNEESTQNWVQTVRENDDGENDSVMSGLTELSEEMADLTLPVTPSQSMDESSFKIPSPLHSPSVKRSLHQIQKSGADKASMLIANMQDTLTKIQGSIIEVISLVKKVLVEVSSSIEQPIGDDFPDLPLNKIESWRSMEKALHNAEKFGRAGSFFYSIGGANPRDCVYNCMKMSFTDKLASQISFKGIHRGANLRKAPFVGTHLFKCITGAVRKRYGTSVTLHQICNLMGNWLKDAPARARKKVERREARQRREEELCGVGQFLDSEARVSHRGQNGNGYSDDDDDDDNNDVDDDDDNDEAFYE